MNPPRLSYRQFCLIILLAWCALVSLPSGALALSAQDLIVVYNRNVPDSQAVAAYYAEKRQVPPDNLVGVEVSSTEDMSRKEFDEKLTPPVRTLVNKLKTQGRTPAILLAYGIPLRVGAAPATKADQALGELATQKLNEYQKQVMELAMRLDQLTPALPALPGKPVWGEPSKKLTYTPRQILTMAQQSYQRGVAYLQKQPADPKNRSEITSLLIKLGGVSPEAQALMARTAQKRDRHLPPRQREFLGLNQDDKQEVEEGMFRGILPDTAQKTAAAIGSTRGLLGEMKFWFEARLQYENHQTIAAVDSELTLIIAGPYQKTGWLPNPWNLTFNRLSFIRAVRDHTVMVGRLDGPTPAIARRLVDDALAVEKTGLNGVFYIDARGLSGKAATGNYAWFDEHLLRLSDLMAKYSAMKVVLDKKPAVFPPGSCPDAALYCGWYSAGNYVPAFKWQKGAVGYHVASYEATTLKKPDGKVWCKRMLEEGVAATLGPVTEPYLNSFPLPDQFFPILMTGKLTLIEVYFLTVPQVSWMQILIGDPLYCPFKKNPAIQASRGKDVVPPKQD
ncbi:MAG: TIGR03790 family protein [Desulfobaccales bacterium]